MIATARGPFVTDYGPDGVLRWHVDAQAFDFNDTLVDILKSVVVPLDEYGGDIVLTHARAIWEPTTSGAGIVGRLSAHFDNAGSYIRLDTVVSTATVTKLEWAGHFVCKPWRTIDPAYSIIKFAVPAGTVTTLDDMHILVEGMVYRGPLQHDHALPQPVSLEGYKWPLTRR